MNKLDMSSYFLSFLFFFLIIGFGYIFTNRVLKRDKLVYLIPYSVCIGSSFFITCLHAVSLITQPSVATYISLLIIFVISLLLLARTKSGSNLSLGIPKIQFVSLFVFSTLLGALTFWHLIAFSTYDPLYQCVGTITKQNIYPPYHPFSPDTRSAYHYGVLLYGSALKFFSNIETWNSLIPVQLLFVFITPFVIFSFIFSISKSFLPSFFSSIIGCLCPNLTFLKIPTLFQGVRFDELLQTLHKNLVLMNESGFAVSVSKSFVSPNISVAIPISIYLFYLCTSEKAAKRNYQIVILFVSIFLLSTYESFWMPIVIAVFLYHLFLLLTKNTERITQLKTTVILTTIFLLSPYIGQGVLAPANDNIVKLVHYEPKTYIYSWSGILGQFYPNDWFSRNEVVSHSDGCRFYKVPFLSKYFFVELGLPFVLLPLIIAWLISRKNTILSFFLISGMTALSLPFLITYTPRVIEPIRFFILARFIFSILFGILLGYLFKIKLPPLLKIIYNLVFIFFITMLVLPGIVWLIPKKFTESDYRYNQIPLVDKKALTWLRGHVKPQDRGLGPTNVPHRHFELINVAGVYGSSVGPQIIFQDETRNTALTTLNPCLLKELKITWIYLNPELSLKVPQDKLNHLLEEKILLLHYRNKDSSRRIYKFQLQNNNKYCIHKDYSWIVGRMIDGKFIPCSNRDTNLKTTFQDKESALKSLEEIKKHLTNKQEAYFYRIEAIKS